MEYEVHLAPKKLVCIHNMLKNINAHTLMCVYSENETRDILLKINQLIQERKKQYTIDVAIEYAKNFQTSCDGPAIEVPATLNTSM